ncbi:MAG: hypothetical protein JWP72_582 [Massilia sp.]|nr:hypothetical protein [Massilia sp.]MDB5791249.1 hypothetical protein [Massilia sp.]
MYKTLSMLTFVLAVCNVAQAAGSICTSEPADRIHLDERYSYKVAGTGRLYIHTGPDKKCLDKNVFVVPGDKLVAYAEYGQKGEWSSVMYTSKTGQDYAGWVLTERLMFEGAFGQNTTPEKVKYYEKAAMSAKAGKMGSP